MPDALDVMPRKEESGCHCYAKPEAGLLATADRNDGAVRVDYRPSSIVALLTLTAG